jgi:prepilin-type N-terminal cleavage/methylation domain-containing protein
MGPADLMRRQRRGFTAIELGVAMTLLAVALVLVAQLGLTSLRERGRSDARYRAIEAAANVLESARARPWADLTPDWAAAQQLSDGLRDALRDGKLLVQVTPEASLPQTKRVVVEVQWMLPEQIEASPVRVEALFTARSRNGEGGEP